MSLTFRETTSLQRLLLDWYSCYLRYTLGNHLTLVISSLTTTFAGQGHWHDDIHTIEKTLRLEYPCCMTSHINAYIPSSQIFHLVYQTCHLTFRMKMEQGVCPYNITTTQNTTQHGIVIGIIKDSTHGILNQTTAANDMFSLMQTGIAHDTTSWQEEVNQQLKNPLQHIHNHYSLCTASQCHNQNHGKGRT